MHLRAEHDSLIESFSARTVAKRLMCKAQLYSSQQMGWKMHLRAEHNSLIEGCSARRDVERLVPKAQISTMVLKNESDSGAGFAEPIVLGPQRSRKASTQKHGYPELSSTRHLRAEHDSLIESCSARRDVDRANAQSIALHHWPQNYICGRSTIR